jgi:uncharacterized membrane protein
MSRVEQASSAAQTVPTKVPRSCSDVFRLWAAVLVSPLVALAFQIVVYVAEVTGLRQLPTGQRATVEFDFGDQLITWNSFAVTYLLLGIRAFSKVGRAELVRRILATPLPASRVKRWLFAGGGGTRFPMLISLVAFSTVATAVVNQDDLTALVLGLALASVASSWAVLTFSFAVYYARKDIEEPGLEFGGSDEPAFSDYIYLAIGCSTTFGTTDTIITSRSMRRAISIHSLIAFVLNTVVVAVLLSIVVK